MDMSDYGVILVNKEQICGGSDIEKIKEWMEQQNRSTRQGIRKGIQDRDLRRFYEEIGVRVL